MIANDSNLVRIGQLELYFLVDEIQSNGSVVMFEFVAPPNARVPASHYHRDVDEIVYGLAGTITSTRGSEKYEIGKGDSLFIPRGTVHMHENLGNETGRLLSVLTPGSIGRPYFEEMAVAINGPGKPDMARIKDIMLRHGLIPA